MLVFDAVGVTFNALVVSVDVLKVEFTGEDVIEAVVDFASNEAVV